MAQFSEDEDPAIRELSMIEKAKVKEIYDSLEESDMWKLSTGTFVEKKMGYMAMSRDYEHPCHSLILDPSDLCWIKYFTSKELQEIKTFNKPAMEPLPSHLREFLDTIAEASTPSDLYKAAAAYNMNYSVDNDLMWMRNSIMMIAKLFVQDKLPVKSHWSEMYLLRTIWNVLYEAFNKTPIDVLFDETPAAIATTRNNLGRILDTTLQDDIVDLSEDKFDLLYTAGGVELGCSTIEWCHPHSFTVRQFDLGTRKLSKALKDVLYVLVESRPHLIRRLKTVGMVVKGLNAQLSLMESPAGKVFRVSHADVVGLPNNQATLVKDMRLCLELVWKFKAALIDTNEILDTKTSPSSIDSINKLLGVKFPPTF